MAGGKQSPRQRMVNLMYLVFICMLALNMSKEVLSAFGIMNAKFEASNQKTTDNNMAFLESLETKASEDAAKYAEDFAKAKEIKGLSQEYYDYLAALKEEMQVGIEDRTDFQVMDKTDFLDQKFFNGDVLSPEGQEFLDKLIEYRTNLANALPAKMSDLKASIAERFNTGDENNEVANRDGIMLNWVKYKYEGYPLIASLTNLTSLQNDIKITEEAALKAMLAGNLTDQVSLKNFKTSLFGSKSAYYAGEKYDGKIVISKTDNSSTPVRAELTLDGRKLAADKDYIIEPGGIKMLFGAGSPGDHKVEGTMYFMQDGEEIPVQVNSSFATISKPNGAVIAADKMNVVYRGVANPMTISIPGIPDSKVSASAPGLKSVGGSKYIMNPQSGRSVTISASGKLPDGSPVGSKLEFRIKDIPRPNGSIRGETNTAKMPRNNLEISTVGAILEDFDFDLNLAVSGFKFRVPGQPTVVVRGNKLNAAAKSALKRAGRGDAVQIFDIEAYITNNKTYRLKKVSPVVVELTN